MTTILPVDDDPNILRPLRWLIEQQGFRVLTALHGEAALAEVAICRPSLIAIDWTMPRLSGLDLCRRLESDVAAAAIPVVMLSAALPPDAGKSYGTCCN